MERLRDFPLSVSAKGTVERLILLLGPVVLQSLVGRSALPTSSTVSLAMLRSLRRVRMRTFPLCKATMS
jgi:hypothetical protein